MDPYKPITPKAFSLFMFFALVISISAYSWFVWATEKTILAAFSDKSATQSKLVNSAIRQHMDQLFSDINMLAMLPEVRSISDDLTTYMSIKDAHKRDPNRVSAEERKLYNYFKTYAEQHFGTRYVYLATESGGYLVWPEGEVPSNYDPRIRPWYILGLAGNGGILQTQPYVDLVDNKMIISNVRSFKDPTGKVRGVIGIDTDMGQIIPLSKATDAFKEDELMIVHPSGLILFDSMHTDRDYKFIKDVAPYLGDYLELKNTFSFKNQGKNYYGRSETIPELGWHIVMLSERSNLLARTENVLHKYMLASFSFVLALMLVVFIGTYQQFYNKSLHNLVKRRTLDLQETIDALIIKEQNLGKSEQRYITLVNNIPGVVFRCEPFAPWRMWTISNGTYELTGYGPEDFLGENPTVHWDDLIHEEDRDEVNRILGVEEFRDYELTYRMIHRSGEMKWVYERGSIVRQEDSQGSFIDGIIFDMTDRKIAEDEIKRLYTEMEIRVEERTSALENAMAQLIEQEKMASLGGIISGVAHEINTPLGIGITAASFLKKNEDELAELFEKNHLSKSKLTELIQTSKESLELLETNLNRAAELVNTFKLISVNQVTGDISQFNLKDTLNMVLLTLKHEYKNKHYHIDVVCPEEITLNSYPGAYSQIFTIFLMNSFIHGFKGIEAGEIKIEAYTKPENAHLIVRYEDNGVGIAEADLGRIFEPFFTTDRTRGGSGLGLYIVYNIVTQKLEGTVKCQSEVGKGTVFTLEVPLK